MQQDKSSRGSEGDSNPAIELHRGCTRNELRYKQ